MDTATQPPALPRPALWNPNAACNWSILFSAAFGAYLQSRNLTALGQPAKARTSLAWCYTVAALFAAYLIVPDEVLPLPQLLRRIPLIILVVWYIFNGREQGRYVKEHLPDGYEKKKWGRPLLIALGLFVAFIIVGGIATAVYEVLFVDGGEVLNEAG